MAGITPTPIPEPRGYPFIGHIAEVDREFILGAMVKFAENHGEIYRLRFPGSSMVVVSTVKLADELLDEKRFQKRNDPILQELRHGIHDGLFTAYNDEPNWGIAHRVLMPAFGPKGIQDMFDGMHDIASQLVLKWARVGPQQKLHVTDDFTRLALDTLALCSMGFRFNNFYSTDPHPFVDAMGEFLIESGRRVQRPLPGFFYRTENEKYAANIQIMRETAESVLKERESGSESGRKDLLNAMLKGRDSLSGQKMSDASIIDNLITFLVAGHETTSGTLSYAMYELLRHPEEYKNVQKEVDEVVGKGPITVKHMQKFPYIEAVLRETMRLDAPITVLPRGAIKDGTLLGGKYLVNKDDQCVILLTKTHLDPAVYDNPTAFRPERMLTNNFNKLPKNAWRPFGSGVRACIGRPFAWQEAVLAMAMLFQNFDFEFDDPTYVLHHKQTLTIKPDNFFIKAKPRHGMSPTDIASRIGGSGDAPALAKHMAPPNESGMPGNGDFNCQPMTILYGSNSGTCETMADRLACNASLHGYKITRLECLDAAVGNLPHDQPVVLITPSYEGQPPDNAAKFVSWVESVKGTKELCNVRYAVFGCGSHDWPHTFHRIPKLLDEGLASAEAHRLVNTGLADAASDDVFIVFDNWGEEVLWPALEAMLPPGDLARQQTAPSASLQVQVSNTRSSLFNMDLQEARVVATRRIVAQGEPIKMHTEIELPRGTFYRAGDYLTVLPFNSREVVLRALRHFQLPLDANITLGGAKATRLPKNVPMPVQSILSDFVELGQPAMRSDVSFLAKAPGLSTEDKLALEWLTSDGFEAEIVQKRISVLDILDRYPSIDLPFGTFLSMLPIMRLRQYSISSSPSYNSSRATLTYAVLKAKARSGNGEHSGVASSYLAGLQPGDMLRIAVRASHEAFHLPQEQDQTPLILVGAGTGIAPFRGFLQERAEIKKSGHKLAPAVLYHGCRQPGKDDLYADELREWETLGVVTVKRTFSRTPQESNGHKYVQDAIWDDRQELLKIWRQGGLLYVCGSTKVYRAVEEKVIRFKQDVIKSKGKILSEKDAAEWWTELRNSRYAVDIFD